MFGSGQIFCLVSFQQNPEQYYENFDLIFRNFCYSCGLIVSLTAAFWRRQGMTLPVLNKRTLFFYPTQKINGFKGDCKAQIVSGKTYSRTCIGWSPCIKRPVFKIPNLFPLSITVIFTSIGRLLLLSSRGHLWVSPIGLFVSSFVRVERSLKAGPLKWNLE